MQPEKTNFDENLKVMRDTRKEIDAITREVFRSHFARLIEEPLSYIVYAVWGTKNNGTLTSDQKAINNKIEHIIKKLEPILKLNSLGSSQKFAIQYIMRELIITKLVFMVEMLREKVRVSEEKDIDLENIEPFGHA